MKLGSGSGAGGRGAHQSALETVDLFASRYLHQGEELRMEEVEDDQDIADTRQFWSLADGRLRVRLIAMIGEGHYVPVASGEKKALVIGPRRGAVHAPREGKPIDLSAFFFGKSTCLFRINWVE